VWGAQGPSGAIFLYAEHQLPHGEPSENAGAIRRLGSGIVGVISAVSLKGSHGAQNRIAYRQHGLNIQIVRQGEEAAECKFWHLQVTHKIKVFASLPGWLRAYRMGDEESPLQLRQQQSQPILDKLRDYLEEIQMVVLPKSPEGRAVRYALKNWTALTRYCEDGDLEIDNNATERSIRSVAVGRRNWTFFGSDQGGKTAAVLRSFVASCQRAGVEPFAWFQDVLSRIASHPISRIAELLPHNWALAQV
jgi:hypothetical protein